MEVFTYVSPGFSCNTYLCRDEKTGESVLIDPGVSAEGVLRFLGQTRPQKILLTHGHFDHVMAADSLRKALGVQVCAHRLEQPLLQDANKNASAFFRAGAVSFCADVLLEEGDTVEFGEAFLRVLHTPGHSPGGICLVGEESVFCGDTLFSEGVGRTDLYGGNEEKLFESIERLGGLPGSFRAYPGHGDSFLLSWRIAQF